MPYAVNDWAIFLTVSILTSLLSLLGNAFAIAVISASKTNSNTYTYMKSQCFSDGIYGAINLVSWYFCSYRFSLLAYGWRVCQAVHLIQITTLTVSLLTFVTVALDRYVKTFHFKRGLPARNFIPALWTLGALRPSHMAPPMTSFSSSRRAICWPAGRCLATITNRWSSMPFCSPSGFSFSALSQLHTAMDVLSFE